MMNKRKLENEIPNENTSKRFLQDKSDSLGIAFNEKLRPYIDLIDNLRRNGLQTDIDLPNVVIVGDQSSGKSSIIEAISGIQLPRGKGIVTRCPLELQLKRIKDKPWEATLSYKLTNGKFEKIYINNPKLVEKNVIKAQEMMCGAKYDVSSELITLRIESPASTAPDLTLIDLPGIARIAVEGQPQDICEKIHKIIKTYIENTNTVILCVVSANLDAAVNESIKLAKEVDPSGVRTLGVITKPDTADENQKEDALKLLNNEKIKLVKGFHMVKCRSQKELDEKLNLDKSLENEIEFFKTDKVYKDATKSQLGIMNLAHRITMELFQVIQTNLPTLQENIFQSLKDSKIKLSKLEVGIPDDEKAKMCYLTEQISRMNQEIESSLIYGERKSNKINLFHSWRDQFNTLKTNIYKIKLTDITQIFNPTKLEDQILKSRGNEISGFLKFQLFEDLIREHVIKYKVEAENILVNMKQITNQLVTEIIKLYFNHIPTIESDLKIIALTQIALSENLAMERINEIFEEENLVFTQDEAFDKQLKLLKADDRIKVYKETLESLSENAKKLQEIIKCYLEIVNNRLSDMIPMTLRHNLHIKLNKILREKFFEYITNPENAEKAYENPITRQTRENLHKKIKRLQLARGELMKNQFS